MVIERGDHQVLDEPYSVPYYFGSGQRSTRFSVSEPAALASTVAPDLEALAASGPVFVKDMAYHATEVLSPALLVRFTNTFLVRDPAFALPSLWRRWPDLTWEEAGYEAQLRAFGIACDVGGAVPPVLDSDDLRRHPDATVRAWCEAVGIDHRSEALSWKPGMQPQWLHWRDWYEAAAASTGFEPPPDDGPPSVADPRLVELIDRARPVYDEIARHRLCP